MAGRNSGPSCALGEIFRAFLPCAAAIHQLRSAPRRVMAISRTPILVAVAVAFVATSTVAQIVQGRRIASLDKQIAALRTTVAQQRSASLQWQPPADALSIRGSASRGTVKADVVLIEFSDFECTYCSRFASGALREIVTEYVDTGRVLLVFKNFPIPRHSMAMRAAEAGACAARQDRFWQVHDLLFEHSSKLDLLLITASGKRVGANEKAFEECLANPPKDQIQTDIADGQRLGITGTPSFFLGRLAGVDTVKLLRRSSGAITMSQFREMVEPLLTDQR